MARAEWRGRASVAGIVALTFSAHLISLTHGEQVHNSHGSAITLQDAFGAPGISSADYQQRSAADLLDAVASSDRSTVAIAIAEGSLLSVASGSLPNATHSTANPSVTVPPNLLPSVRSAAARSNRTFLDACSNSSLSSAPFSSNSSTLALTCSSSASVAASHLSELMRSRSATSSALLLRGSPIATMNPASRKLLQDESSTSTSQAHSQKERELMHVQAVLIQVIAVGGVLFTMLACGLGCMSVLDSPDRFEKPAGQGNQQQQQQQ